MAPLPVGAEMVVDIEGDEKSNVESKSHLGKLLIL